MEVSRRERDKGRAGEAEVAALYRTRGLEVRGLEAGGDHLIVCGPASGELVHSETKRQETARVWAWWEQASTEAPAGSRVVVNFRRNRSPWLSLIATGELADLLAELERARAALADSRARVAELELELYGDRS